MLNLRATAIASVAALTLAFSASEGSAENAGQKLCVNSSTGATRVIDATESCRRAETTVKIPVGKTTNTSSYIVPGSGGGGYLSLSTADGSAALYLFCAPTTDVYWFALVPEIKAGDIQIFNAIEGQAFQAYNDLVFNGGSMDHAVVPARPWTGVFTAKYGKSLSRFEVTVSEINGRGDCLVTLFSIGLGEAQIVKY